MFRLLDATKFLIRQAPHSFSVEGGSGTCRADRDLGVLDCQPEPRCLSRCCRNSSLCLLLHLAYTSLIFPLPLFLIC